MSEHSTKEPSAAAGGTCGLLSLLCTLKSGGFADTKLLNSNQRLPPNSAMALPPPAAEQSQVTFHTIPRKSQGTAFTLL